MTDAIVILIVYLIVTIISLWSVHSIFNSIEAEGKLSIVWLAKAKLALVCSMAYLLPIIFFRALDGMAFLLYFVTIPFAVIAIQKMPENSISLRSAVNLFFGISARMIVVVIMLGGVSRLIIWISKSQ